MNSKITANSISFVVDGKEQKIDIPYQEIGCTKSKCVLVVVDGELCLVNLGEEDEPRTDR